VERLGHGGAGCRTPPPPVQRGRASIERARQRVERRPGGDEKIGKGGAVGAHLALDLALVAPGGGSAGIDLEAAAQGEGLERRREHRGGPGCGNVGVLGCGSWGVLGCGNWGVLLQAGHIGLADECGGENHAVSLPCYHVFADPVNRGIFSSTAVTAICDSSSKERGADPEHGPAQALSQERGYATEVMPR
jgi:hypothetical protein